MHCLTNRQVSTFERSLLGRKHKMSRNQYQCINVVLTTATSSLSRNEMVQWINDSLDARIAKIEDMSNGQLMPLMKCFINLFHLFRRCLLQLS